MQRSLIAIAAVLVIGALLFIQLFFKPSQAPHDEDVFEALLRSNYTPPVYFLVDTGFKRTIEFNKVENLVVSITPRVPLLQAEVELTLPSGIELVNATRLWRGKTSVNQTTEVMFPVKVVEHGELIAGVLTRGWYSDEVIFVSDEYINISSSPNGITVSQADRPVRPEDRLLTQTVEQMK